MARPANRVALRLEVVLVLLLSTLAVIAAVVLSLISRTTSEAVGDIPAVSGMFTSSSSIAAGPSSTLPVEQASFAAEEPSNATTDSRPVDSSIAASPAGAISQVPIRSGALEDQAAVESPSPLSVRIAAIGVDASVVEVGVDDVGDFEVPPAEQVGWYGYGPAPGEAGSAVLAAHVDYGGFPGAFFELSAVVPGVQIEVDFDDGVTRLFEVVARRRYGKDELPSADLFRRDGEPGLALITCGGDFNRQLRSYEDNTVVYAVPIS